MVLIDWDGSSVHGRTYSIKFLSFFTLSIRIGNCVAGIVSASYTISGGNTHYIKYMPCSVCYMFSCKNNLSCFLYLFLPIVDVQFCLQQIKLLLLYDNSYSRFLEVKMQAMVSFQSARWNKQVVNYVLKSPFNIYPHNIRRFPAFISETYLKLTNEHRLWFICRSLFRDIFFGFFPDHQGSCWYLKLVLGRMLYIHTFEILLLSILVCVKDALLLFSTFHWQETSDLVDVFHIVNHSLTRT